MDEMAPDIVQSESGYSVLPDDEKILAAALADLLTEETGKWKERCNRASALIDRSRSWEGIAENLGRKLRELG